MEFTAWTYAVCSLTMVSTTNIGFLLSREINQAKDIILALAYGRPSIGSHYQKATHLYVLLSSTVRMVAASRAEDSFLLERCLMTDTGIIKDKNSV